jgi:hypothetical protein
MAEAQEVLVATGSEQATAELPPAPTVLRRGGGYEIDDVLRIPSLPELLAGLADAGADLEEPAVAGLVPERDVIAFGLQHGVELERIGQLLRREAPYEVLIARGLLQSIRLNFLLFEQGDPILREVGVPLPVAELHAPPLQGCVSSYQVTSKRSGRGGLMVRIRGIGAGGGVSALLKFQDRLWTEAECGQVTIPGNIEIVPWTNPDSGQTIHVVSITEISAGEWSLTAIPTGRLHLCSGRFEEVVAAFTEQERRGWARADRSFRRHTVSVAGGLERTRELERNREFAIDLGGLVEVRSQFTEAYAYAYKIVARADYLGFFEAPRSEVFFWSWRTLA